MKKKTMKFISLLLAGAMLAPMAFAMPAGAAAQDDTSFGVIHVLNTGWADAIVLESDGHYALVDAGEPGHGPYIVSYLQRLVGSQAVTLDFVIGTHSHIDHMGGFDFVLRHPDVTVKAAYAKRERNQNADGSFGGGYYREFLAACQSKGIDVFLDDLDNAALTLGQMKITLVNGEPLKGGTTNQDSLCQFIELGGYTAVLAGDMVTEYNEMYTYGQIGRTVDFLKVGHHGQRDSTGRKWANSIRPAAAVYTSGGTWETDTHDVTLGVKKGLDGYHNLKRVDTKQYVTTDNGGIKVEFKSTSGMTLHAIKEFVQKKGDEAFYEAREDIQLREIAEPELTFGEKVKLFFQNLWDCIANYFVSLWDRIVNIFE